MDNPVHYVMAAVYLVGSTIIPLQQTDVFGGRPRLQDPVLTLEPEDPLRQYFDRVKRLDDLRKYL